MSISPARTAAFDILLRVGREDAYASELLHSSRLEPLSPPDRGLATELVMGVLRWRSRLDDAITAAASRTIGKLDSEVVTALRIGAYQLQYLSRIPAHAAINDSVNLVKRARKSSAAPFANAVLRKLAKEASPADPSALDKFTLKSAPAAGHPTHPRFSDEWGLARELAHPEWLVERWVAAYGMERAQAICEHDQRVPSTAIRLDHASLADELGAAGVELAPGALLASARLVTAGDVTHTRSFREGRVFIQDEASQLVAALVGTGSRLLDCCAAPGGKTAAIASRNPTAQIVAAELHAHRAELLRNRVRAPNVQVVQADALELPAGDFDRVLADVPCSGTGTLARNPEIKWKLKPEDIGDLRGRQIAILRAALGQLAPGGRAVYSTCSLEREECEGVVEEVLHDQVAYKLRDCRAELERLRSESELVWSDIDSLLNGSFLRTIPGVHPCDGFFAAVIERTSAPK